MRALKILMVLVLSALSFMTYGQEAVDIKEDNSEQVYMVVDQFPLFSGCNYSEMDSLAEMKVCSDEKIIDFVSSNITYPRKARKKGIQGIVYVRFVINSEGLVRDEQIAKGIGGGCDEVVLKMVRSFPKWVPGKLDGKPVAVMYTLPVTFSIPKKK